MPSSSKIEDEGFLYSPDFQLLTRFLKKASFDYNCLLVPFER